MDQFEQLVDEYLPAVYNLVCRLTGRVEEAQDLSQEVFIKVWKNLKRYDPIRANRRTWILAIARNTTIDWLRKKKIPTDGELEESVEDPAPLPDKLFAVQELEQLLEQVLATIAPDDRLIIILHHQENLTFEEIAKIIEKPVNTVKSRYRRALHRIRLDSRILKYER